MAGEVLSSEEVDYLLSMMDCRTPKPTPDELGSLLSEMGGTTPTTLPTEEVEHLLNTIGSGTPSDKPKSDENPLRPMPTFEEVMSQEEREAMANALFGKTNTASKPKPDENPVETDNPYLIERVGTITTSTWVVVLSSRWNVQKVVIRQ